MATAASLARDTVHEQHLKLAEMLRSLLEPSGGRIRVDDDRWDAFFSALEDHISFEEATIVPQLLKHGASNARVAAELKEDYARLRATANAASTTIHGEKPIDFVPLRQLGRALHAHVAREQELHHPLRDAIRSALDALGRHIEVEALFGVGGTAGAITGAVAGPPGMIAGAVVGAAIGAVAGEVLEENDHRDRIHTNEIDRIGTPSSRRLRAETDHRQGAKARRTGDLPLSPAASVLLQATEDAG